MKSISDLILYVLIFLSAYAQVFFFITFLENNKKIITRKGGIKLGSYPGVTIVVPCWNEGKTVERTLQSLLHMNYPQEKLNIFIVDDGSTDNTWNVVSKFSKYSNVKLFQKENGGKFTTLNLGLEKMETDFFGCLDSDSYADPEALVRIMSYFERDKNTMAVAPSVTVNAPKNILQHAQQAEYHLGVYLKKMLGFMGAINVTPGPLTIFRKKVFDDLGPYRHGHNTEDMEIAYRMQKHRYKIEHCNDAYVYTNIPSSIKKLFKQRLRWIYGFINNTMDYRGILFQKKYGNFSTFTLPTGIISIFAVSYLFSRMIYNFIVFASDKVFLYRTIGFHFSTKALSFDPFFINIRSVFLPVILIYAMVIFAMLFGRRMAEGKWVFSPEVIYFFPVFGIIAPFWLLKAVYNTILSRKPNWR
ncbi:MAG: glycosyltransferase [Candidatus Paceibacterota bacterium]